MTCPACGEAVAVGGVICARCGKVLDPSGRLPVGFTVGGRFELRRFLGEGGMGTVYEAFDRTLEEPVALKLLKADFAHSLEMSRRFRHEIKLARKLRHPNVCAIHEYGEVGPLHYISMELIEGTDLKRRLRSQGPMPVAEGFRVALQITQGLHCIHQAGVVHRDLKTSNVMLDRRGDVRLMDFGIAKQLGAEATLGATAVGSIIGTPEYMSPEQARGETIDYRSDLYSLGVVIYEIFTGDVPFRGDTPIATIFKTLQDPLDLDAPAARGIPVAMRPVLLRALAKSAAERFSSAEEMAAALVAARDATLGPGATFAFPPTAMSPAPQGVLGSAPTVASGFPATPPPLPRAGQQTPALRPHEATWHTPMPGPGPGALPPSAPAAAANGARTVLPVLLGAIGLTLALVVGAAAVYVLRSPGGERPPAPVAVQPSAEPSNAAVTSVEASPAPSSVPTPEPTRPVPSPGLTPRPSARPSPAAATPRPAATAIAIAMGQLQLYVKPWAEVSVDDLSQGSTPLRPINLSAGLHSVQLRHPAYAPLVRQVTIKPGETTRLEINLPVEGQRLP